MKNLLLFVFLLCCLAFAQTKFSVGILPSLGDIDDNDLKMLTAEISVVALDKLPISDFILVKDEKLTSRIGEKKFFQACKEGSCIAELGKEANVDYIVQCRISSQAKGKMRMELEFAKSSEGTIGMFTGEAKSVYELVDLIKKEAPARFEIVKADAQAEKEKRENTEQKKVEEERVEKIDTQISHTETQKYRSTEEAARQVTRDEKWTAPFWLPYALDAVGAIAIAGGLYQNSAAASFIDDRKYEDARNSASNRNIAYTIGVLALAGGITLHILF